MGGASKIIDEQEVLRWFEEGKSYNWMCNEYLSKYNIETVSTMWSNFRSRRGLPRKIARNDNLIPWAVNLEHRQLYPLAMLRLEARRRDNFALKPADTHRLENWRESLGHSKTVVHYDPDTEQGFFYIPRGENDTDLIHEPKIKSTARPRAE